MQEIAQIGSWVSPKTAAEQDTLGAVVLASSTGSKGLDGWKQEVKHEGWSGFRSAGSLSATVWCGVVLLSNSGLERPSADICSIATVTWITCRAWNSSTRWVVALDVVDRPVFILTVGFFCLQNINVYDVTGNNSGLQELPGKVWFRGTGRPGEIICVVETFSLECRSLL